MAIRTSRKWKRWLVALFFIGALTGGTWLGRIPALAWYYLRGLEAATVADRETWAERAASLDEAVLPGLLAMLDRGSPETSANAGAGLLQLLQAWDKDDSRSLQVLDDLAKRFPSLSVSARETALDVQVALWRDNPPDSNALATLTATRLLMIAAESAEENLQLRTLVLAEALVDRVPPTTTAFIGRLASAGLQAKATERRVRALHLTLHASLRHETALLEKVLPLLKDPVAEVRRTALLTVGVAEQLVSEEDLLPFLHDSDSEVRRICESALRARGLLEQHILLARLITDADAMARLSVVLHLGAAENLDHALWLRRLTLDMAPAVRAAALRATAQYPDVDLSERINEMSVSDPEATVRQLAAYYLRQPRRR